MSAEHVGWAFRQPLPTTRKFVLVALADRCNKDTLRCDPSVRRLSEDTGLDRSTIIRAMQALEDDGYIKRIERHGTNGSQVTNQYEFPEVGGRTDPLPPSQNATPPRRTVRPEPEVRTRKEPTSAAAPRKRNEIWDTLTHMFGEPTTPTSIKARGKNAAELKAAGATADEILKRGRSWPSHFDQATLTEWALVKHWHTLGRRPLRAGGK